jgi:hypothetical protein
MRWLYQLARCSASNSAYMKVPRGHSCLIPRSVPIYCSSKRCTISCSQSAERGRRVMKSLHCLPRSKFHLGPKYMLSLALLRPRKPSRPATNHATALATTTMETPRTSTTRKSKSQNTKIETPTLRWPLETPMKHLPLSQPLLVQAPNFVWRPGILDLGSWVRDVNPAIHAVFSRTFRAANFSKATTIRSPHPILHPSNSRMPQALPLLSNSSLSATHIRENSRFDTLRHAR